MKIDALHIRVDALLDVISCVYSDYLADSGSLSFEDFISCLTFVCDGGNFSLVFDSRKLTFRGCLDENGFVVLPDIFQNYDNQ